MPAPDMRTDSCLMKNLCDPCEKKPLSTVHLGRLAIQAKFENGDAVACIVLDGQYQ